MGQRKGGGDNTKAPDIIIRKGGKRRGWLRKFYYNLYSIVYR